MRWVWMLVVATVAAPGCAQRWFDNSRWINCEGISRVFVEPSSDPARPLESVSVRRTRALELCEVQVGLQTGTRVRRDGDALTITGPAYLNLSSVQSAPLEEFAVAAPVVGSLYLQSIHIAQVSVQVGPDATMDIVGGGDVELVVQGRGTTDPLYEFRGEYRTLTLQGNGGGNAVVRLLTAEAMTLQGLSTIDMVENYTIGSLDLQAESATLGPGEVGELVLMSPAVSTRPPALLITDRAVLGVTAQRDVVWDLRAPVMVLEPLGDLRNLRFFMSDLTGFDRLEAATVSENIELGYFDATQSYDLDLDSTKGHVDTGGVVDAGAGSVVALSSVSGDITLVAEK